MGISQEQYDALLRPLASTRVANRKQGGMNLSYLEAWDVKAHLIRVFGFGGWSWQVTTAELAFEDKNEKGQWNVGYKVIGSLTIHALDCCYSEAAVGSANLPQRGEAHDMAVKTAESDALKRAAINLGTQFGLSLYDNGSKRDVVGSTLAPEFAGSVKAQAREEEDVVFLGEVPDGFVASVTAAKDEEALKTLWQLAVDNNFLDAPTDGEHDTVRGLIVHYLMEMRADV